MAYVQPNSKIQLFKGINLDNRYLHTIYFANTAAQTAWFDGKVTAALTFNNLMYRRYTDNQVKVEVDATKLLGVTYMRFQNDRAVDKWFYAFVLSCDYVNENTTIITYEIDVMQTWFIQGGSVRPCMVLREHVTNDTFTNNLEEEPIGTDVYDCDELYRFGQEENSDVFANYSVVMQTTGIPQPDAGLHPYTQGVFNGAQMHIRECNDADDADGIMNDLHEMLGSFALSEQEEEVVALYTVPSWIAEEYTAFNQLSTPPSLKRPTHFDNYTPKNNKLFMYPYSYLMCTTHTGDVASYRWEYFDGSENRVEFRAEGTYLGGGEIWCYPRAYNGKQNDVDDGLVMNNFPKNALNYDAYQAWIASGGTARLNLERTMSQVRGINGIVHATGQAISTLSTDDMGVQGQEANQPLGARDVSSVTKAAQGTITAGILSAASSLINTGANYYEATKNIEYAFKEAKYRPNIVATKPTCSLSTALREANFYFYHCHVRDDEAKRLDDFFSCYGYAVNLVKAPNLTGRQYWNFVMTQNAVIAGDMPASSKEAIGRIFDSGITFWHNGDQVGNYRQSVSQGSINNPINA